MKWQKYNIVQIIHVFSFSGNTTIDIRLAGGNVSNEGRIEAFFNDAWGSVCGGKYNQSGIWQDESADVACRSIGFRRAFGRVLDGSFGPGNTLIHFDQVECSGSEETLQTCRLYKFNGDYCTTSSDFGISCQTGRCFIIHVVRSVSASYRKVSR